MSRVTPLAARVVTAISDAERRARLLFLANEELSAEEQAVLTSIQAASMLAQKYDFARRAGDWIRDTGEVPEDVELSPWLQRELRLLAESAGVEVIETVAPVIGFPVRVHVAPGTTEIILISAPPEDEPVAA